MAGDILIFLSLNYFFNMFADLTNLSLRLCLCEGVSWSDVTTVPKRKSHRGLDLDLYLNAEVNIRKGWKENGGTK